MNIRNVLKLPLFLATLGLTAGNYNDNQQALIVRLCVTRVLY